MDEKESTSFKPGVWKGNYLDAFGRRANITLHTDIKEGQITGKFELIVSAEDEPIIVTGNLAGKQEHDSVQLMLSPGKSREPISYSAQIMNSAGHATQCMAGIVSAPKNSDFGGGVWIAWRYKSGNQ